MMTKGIKKRMYRNIALLIFLLLASIAMAFGKAINVLLAQSNG
jgi:uncharacterized membrane protein